MAIGDKLVACLPMMMMLIVVKDVLPLPPLNHNYQKRHNWLAHITPIRSCDVIATRTL